MKFTISLREKVTGHLELDNETKIGVFVTPEKDGVRKILTKKEGSKTWTEIGEIRKSEFRTPDQEQRSKIGKYPCTKGEIDLSPIGIDFKNKLVGYFHEGKTPNDSPFISFMEDKPLER